MFVVERESFEAIMSKDDAPAFFGRDSRYAHRIYGAVVINTARSGSARVPNRRPEAMNGGIMRTFLRYLILGLVFVPALALLFHEKPRTVGPEVDRERVSIAHDVAGKRLQAR